MPTATTAPSALFRQRDFAALWWGQLISLLGERCTYLALVALLAEHSHGWRDPRSAWLLSALANVMLAPVLVFAPFAGGWIDRCDLKRVVVTSDLLRSGCILLVPLLYRATGALAPVFAALFLLSTCGVFFLPAKSALTPEIVPAPQLLRANTWLTVAGIVATGVGTLGGGWLVDHWGWTRTLELNGLTYALSAGAMLAIRAAPRAHRPPQEVLDLRHYARRLGEGWRAIRASAAVGVALTALGGLWWCGGFLHVAGTLHVQRAASRPGMERLGVLFAVLGLGGALSAWWVNSAGRHRARPTSLAAATLVAGVGLVLVAATTWFIGFVAAAFLLGLAAAPILLIAETALQESTAPGVRARVFAARDFVMRLTLLASVSLAAWLTRACGARITLLTCGVLAAALGLALLAAVRTTRHAARGRALGI